MQANDIKAFIPSKNYIESQGFYQALGFDMKIASNDLSVFTNGSCSFYLQRFFNEELAKNLILQLSVPDIGKALEVMITRKEKWFGFVYTSINKRERF
ncbi:MAG: hypothetical protein ACJAS1_003506 [Oleiphilaceae bacterium]|jgi:hypothetical protein